MIFSVQAGGEVSSEAEKVRNDQLLELLTLTSPVKLESVRMVKVKKQPMPPYPSFDICKRIFSFLHASYF